MSNTLFKISNEYIEKISHIQLLQELHDEVENENRKKDYLFSIELLEKQLDKIDTDLNKKFGNYINIIKSKQDENIAIDKEIERLKNLKKRNLNLIDRLKYFIMLNLKNIGKTIYKVGLNVISIRKNPPSVNIIDENKIPDKYKETVETIKIHKKKIGDDIKEGKEIPGCELTQSGRIDIK